jgi:hypothetical protein
MGKVLNKLNDSKIFREEFEHLSIYPPNHFQSLENCKIFLDEIAAERGLVSESGNEFQVLQYF